MWINAFSVFDLLAAVLSVGVAFALLYRYLRVTKRVEDGLLVVMLIILFFYAMVTFLVDNIVPSGTPAVAVPRAAERTLFAYRLTYVVGTFLLVSIAHFALRYCKSEHLPGWRASWLYACGLSLCPLFWLDSFIHVPKQPAGYTSNWRCAVPWQPDPGILVYIFLALWLAVHLYVQVLFWWRFWKATQHVSKDLGSNIVWTGIVIWGVAGVIAIVSGAVGYVGVDPTNPIATVSMVLLAIGLGEEYTKHERERVHVTRRFKSYVDPALVKYVIEHPEHEHFDGEVREMTVVFTDLDGFTPLSERLREGIVPLLNEYLKVMTPLIREHNGYRNKWLGDGMMFFYGAPETNPDHAIHAVATVLKMQEMMLNLNARLAAQRQHLGELLPPLAMRTGVRRER